MADLVNGLDAGQLREAIKLMKQQPDLAKFRFRAKNTWHDGAHCSTVIKDFYGAGKEDTSRKQAFELHADEPEVLLGEDHGSNATEALLHALTSCLSTTFIFWATAKGVSVDELVINAEGELDLRGFLGLSQDVRNGYSRIYVTFHVKADADEEQIQELVELAQKHSPVFDIVTHPVEVIANAEMLADV